ncbi:MAG TPA: hypothetical protein VK611_25070 [Acidimicrobiales bacterium]|nr:hypothetical protein [Acidimicrobiales bacterium]
MTVSLGLLLLIVVLAAWKMKGVQLPHVLLGMLLLKASEPGSMVDTLAAESLEIFTSIINAVASGLGQGNIA